MNFKHASNSTLKNFLFLSLLPLCCFAKQVPSLKSHFLEVVGQSHQESYDSLQGIEPSFLQEIDQILHEAKLLPVPRLPAEREQFFKKLGDRLTPVIREDLSNLVEMERLSRGRTENGKRIEGLPLPGNFDDRIILQMLVQTLPFLNLSNEPLAPFDENNRYNPDLQSRLFSFMQTRLRTRSDQKNSVVEQVDKKGSAYRAILSRFCLSARKYPQYYSVIRFCLDKDLDAALKLARRASDVSDKDDFWKRSLDEEDPGEAARARTRESIYRQILPAIEAYGDSSDFPRLLRLIKLNPLVPTKPTDPYRQASCDQALGTYLKLAQMNPASFLVNAKGYAPYYNYSFIDNASRIEGMERFFRRIDLLSSQEMPPHESLELETNKRLDRFLSNQNSRYDQEDLGFFHKSLKSVVSPLLESYGQDEDPGRSSKALAALEFLADLEAKRLSGIKKVDEKSLLAASGNLPGKGMEDFISFLSQSSPALVSALIPYLSHPGEKKFDGMVLDRVFLSCENSVVTKYDTKVRQLALKGVRRQPGKQWPPGIDDVFIGEVAALLYVRASTQRTFPTPPLIRLSSMLSPQLGVYRTKSPFKEFMYNKGENGELLKQSFATICINTQSYDSMMNALRLCLTYGLRDTGRKLARKACSMADDFEPVRQRPQLLQMAIHNFLTFGVPAEDHPILIDLLEDSTQIRLAGYQKGQNRKYIEVRELALMTLLRIAKNSHSIPKGSQIRGYCPIKRFIPLEIVSDPDKWKELNHMVEELTKKLSGEIDTIHD